MTVLHGTLDPLQTLLAWFSPSFPIGAFTYSHGLEWAVEAGDVRDAATLAAWLDDVARFGAGRTDLILCAHAYRAGGDLAALTEIAELGAALSPSKERRLEAIAQGRAFAETIIKTWGSPTLAALMVHLNGAPLILPIAVGVAARDHDIPLPMVLDALLHGFLANLVSAAVRAVPLGQTDGQRVIRDLVPVVRDVAALAISAELDDVGGVALAADIASMKHETQYTRLFRS